jgi:AraC-like DNA-binding protein
VSVREIAIVGKGAPPGGGVSSGSQRYSEYPPPPSLAAHVACLWVQQVSTVGPGYAHLAVPNGCVELACDLDTAAIRIVGPQTKPRRGYLAPGRAVVGVRFRPGAGQATMGLPASEVVDVDVDLESSWGRSGSALGERLAESGSVRAALARLLKELILRAGARTSVASPLGRVVDRLQPWHRCSVEALSRELFLSQRQLRRRCSVAVGHGPKELQRILRFQAFLALTQGRPCAEIELAQVAAAAGYADQPHLSRECLRLSGLTPSRFLTEMSTSCGPTHDHAASFASVRRIFSRTATPGTMTIGRGSRDVRFVQDPRGAAH